MAGIGRQTRGRQRIPMRRIANQDDLYATFSKRRQGLYKKASELSTICGVDIGVIIFSPTNNPYSFFHPNMEFVIDRYRNPYLPRNSHARAVESTTRSRIEELSGRLDEILEEKYHLKEHNKYLDEIDTTRHRGWWEENPIESLNKHQVKECVAWFEAFKAQVESRIEQHQNLDHGPSYATDMGQCYGVPPQGHDPSQSFFAPPPHGASDGGRVFYPPLSPTGGGSGYVYGQFLVPPPSQEQPLNDHFVSQFYFTSRAHDPSGGGGSGHIFFPSVGGNSLVQSSFFHPPPPLNPSANGGITDPIPGHYRYMPQWTQDSSTVGGSGRAGPSDQKKEGK